MYQDQVTQLRRELRMVALPGLAVDTVDAFEGEEADVVILSLVRSNEAERIGFLKKAQRLNVAISRAKQLLVVVGDIETMTGREGNDLYRPLLEHVEREGRVAGIGALHAMDAAVGGRRTAGRRQPPRPGTPGRPSRRRRRGGFGVRPPSTPGATPPAGVSAEGDPPAAPETPPTPGRKYRRRRGRRRGGFTGSGAPAANGVTESAGDPPVSEPNGQSASPVTERREPAIQAAERPA